MGLRKTCIRLSMKMGTGMDYFVSLSLFELMQTVKDFVEVMNDINEAHRKAVKSKR